MSTNKPKGKRYKCPYCEYRGYRVELVEHVEDKHEDMIPKDYTPARVVYNAINKKDHGSCMICHKETKWDENKQRYDTLCGSKKCKDEYVKIVRSRMVKKYGTHNLLTDPDFQKKMLENRSISGKYKFEDGGSVGYVGSYEKKFLEFMDQFLHIKSYDIISPGPTIPYKYKGKEHAWITDFIYEPYNLVFDIKDGGDNPNTREMKDYREKQTAKEKAIAGYGEYNYIRLTDNKFEQLISIFMELKEKADDKPLIRINESFLYESHINESMTRIDLNMSDLTEEMLIDAANSCAHYTKWCKIDSSVFLNVNELQNYTTDTNNNTFCFAKYTGDPDSLKEILRHCNENNHSKYGEFEVFAKENSNGVWLCGKMTKLYTYKEITESLLLEENTEFIDNIGAYHLEPKIGNKGPNPRGWDEELYSKDIRYGILNDIKSNYNIKDQTTVKAYVYTAGKNLKPIYLGTILIPDKNNPEVWEWEKKELLSDDDYDYLVQNPMESCISESKNDKGEEVPKVCPKCGSKIGVFLKGEPVYLCTNKECNKYFGTVPFKESCINENYLISQDDIKFNFDLWKKNSDHNILFVTGLSGSGKSTLARKLAKEYKAEYVEFDMFTLTLVKGIDTWKSKVNNGSYTPHPLVVEYINQVKFTQPPTNSWATLQTNYHINEHNKFVKWLISRVSGDGKLYVLEGAQFFMNMSEESNLLIAGEPLIVTGTSMMKSWFRRYGRDVGEDKNIKTYLKYLKKDIPALFKYYFENEKNLQDFVSNMSQYYNECTNDIFLDVDII